MKKVLGAIATLFTAGAAVLAGKLVYDAMQDKKRREEEDIEFLNNIEDDFAHISDVESTGQVKRPVATKKVPAKKENKEPKKRSSKISCLDVIDCTAKVLGVSSDDILSKSRKGDVASARRVAIYICSVNLNIDNATICEEFGKIGANSVTNAKRNISEKLKTDDELTADIEDITYEIKQLEKSINK